MLQRSTARAIDSDSRRSQTEANIQLQPCWPNHSVGVNYDRLPGGGAGEWVVSAKTEFYDGLRDGTNQLTTIIETVHPYTTIATLTDQQILQKQILFMFSQNCC